MKRLLFVSLTLIFSLIANSAIKTWIGISGTAWGTPGNWAPAGVPVGGDDVIINTSVIIIIDVITPIALNSIAINGTSNVSFDCAATRNFRLSSTSTIVPGLYVNAGATLTLNALNAGINNSSFDLTYGVGVIGSIYGTLIFSCTGGATNGPKLITTRSPVDPANYGILTVYSGGIIRIMPDADNTDASLSPVPTLIMLNGSTYENLKNGGSFPVGTWEQNSLARAVSPGANVPIFNGTSYGNLEWDCQFQTAIAFLNENVSFNNVNFITTNSARFSVKTGASGGNWTMTINGNLDIASGSFLELVGSTAPSGSSGKIILKGHLTMTGGTLITNGGPGTTSQFELQGSSNQNITIGGTLSGVKLEFVMNGVSATLLSLLWLPGDGSAPGDDLQLVNGKIITTAANILRLNDNATVSGGSTNSFVSGPMQKRGDDNFIFPVGKGSIYAPIGMINVANQMPSDQFTAEYLRANPQSVHGQTYQAPIDHISYVEYWTLNRNVGSTATKRISLAVNYTSFCYDISRTYVSRYDGTQWTFEGSTNVPGPTSPPYVTGTITSVNTILSFSPVPNAFTLSTDLPFAANPLPIHLISFDASKLSNTESSINWKLAGCCSPAAKFEIQRADANKNFRTIGETAGSATNTLYGYTDIDLRNGINYYRLKMTDADGTISYSRTVAIMNGINGLVLTSLIPTIVTNSAALTIASSHQQKLNIVIVDMQGKLVQKSNHNLVTGNTTIEISLSRLSAGVYQLTGISAEGKTNTVRFLKQ
ncbi:MAG: T9SS type A sorting domain-containing protein [Chitinophagales bacterium]